MIPGETEAVEAEPVETEAVEAEALEAEPVEAGAGDRSKMEKRQITQTHKPGKASRKKKQHGSGGRAALWLGMAAGFLILSAMALTVYFRFYGLPPSVQARIDIMPDERAVDGSLRGPGDDPVPEGEYLVMLNQLPTMRAGSRECPIEFENPAVNHYSSRINLYLSSNGKHLGGTRRVDPGQYVETIELAGKLAPGKLEPGEYPVLARIELFTGTDPAGSLSLELLLRVTE